MMKTFRFYLLNAVLLCFFALLLIDPENVLFSGKKAIELCLNIIIPSLLPFFVISRLILKTGAIHGISRLFSPIIKPLFNLPGVAAFPIIAGWFSGYPAGAKYTTDLYESKLLTKTEAQRLLAFTNNSGPLFIVGAIGTGYFKSPALGVVLLICHLLASLTIGIGTGLLSRISGERINDKKEELFLQSSELPGQLLTDAIFDSMKVLIQISGTIIFFAVLVQSYESIGLFSFVGKLMGSGINGEAYAESIKVFMAGSLEITYGLYLLSLSSGIPVHYRVIMTSFFCGFGGLSVYTQVMGICHPDIKLNNYLAGKLFHGLTASFYSWLFTANRTIPAMISDLTYYSTNTWKALICIYAIMLISFIIGLICHQLIHKTNR